MSNFNRVLVFMIFHCTLAYADVLPACSQRDSFAAAGFRCVTSENITFTRVLISNLGLGWKDPNGLVWGDIRQGDDAGYEAAKTVCKQRGGAQIPSIAQFKFAEQEGFRQIVNLGVDYFWTSTPAGDGYRVFDAADGFPSDVNEPENPDTFICVLQAS